MQYPYIPFFVFYLCLWSDSPLGYSQFGLLLRVSDMHNVPDVASACCMKFTLKMLLPAVICCLLWCAVSVLCCCLLCCAVLRCCMLWYALRADECFPRRKVLCSKICQRASHLTCILQAFNKGLFDFLIATDDPSKQGTDSPGPSPADSSAAVAASVSQQLQAAGEAAGEATGEAAGEAAGSLGAEEDGDDAAPDHAWTEAAATAKSTEVKHRHTRFEPRAGVLCTICCWAVCESSASV